jgi:hypothetical protein
VKHNAGSFDDRLPPKERAGEIINDVKERSESAWWTIMISCSSDQERRRTESRSPVVFYRVKGEIREDEVEEEGRSQNKHRQDRCLEKKGVTITGRNACETERVGGVKGAPDALGRKD